MALHSDTSASGPHSSSLLHPHQGHLPQYWQPCSGFQRSTGAGDCRQPQAPPPASLPHTHAGAQQSGGLSPAADGITQASSPQQPQCCLAHPSQIAVSWAPGGLPKGLASDSSTKSRGSPMRVPLDRDMRRGQEVALRCWKWGQGWGWGVGPTGTLGRRKNRRMGREPEGWGNISLSTCQHLLTSELQGLGPPVPGGPCWGHGWPPPS